eukprot:scaffold9231_cov134-Isochrysis_galbana.AAC.1
MEKTADATDAHRTCGVGFGNPAATMRMCVHQPPDGVGGGCVGARAARHDLARGWLGPFTPSGVNGPAP